MKHLSNPKASLAVVLGFPGLLVPPCNMKKQVLSGDGVRGARLHNWKSASPDVTLFRARYHHLGGLRGRAGSEQTERGLGAPEQEGRQCSRVA